jgi:hypothetical protein
MRLLFALTTLLFLATSSFAAISTKASIEELGTRAIYTLDGNLANSSRWSASGKGQWIAYDLGQISKVTAVDVAFYKGTQRYAYFDIQVSSDNRNWKTILANARSNGKTNNFQRFTLPTQSTRYIRILGQGNSLNLWNSYKEVKWQIATATSTSSWWRPTKGITWQWQLNGTINTGYAVDLYSIDLEDTSTSVITTLKQSGKKVLCYFSAGSYEDWRSDKGLFTSSDLGKSLDGWAGERWLDIRSANVRSIMKKRMELARQKGCNGVEPDNVDGYANDNGLSLTAANQLDYNRYLANTAHGLGLTIALKNDLDQVVDLVSSFDLAINEECHLYNECNLLKPFIDQNKPVVTAEYASKYVSQTATRDAMCSASRSMGLHTLVMPLELNDSFRLDCGKP